MPPTSDPEPLIRILLSDPAEPLSDQWLCSLVRLQLIMEDISNIFSGVNGFEEFDKPSTQYKLQMSRQRLQSWKDTTPGGVDTRKCFFSSSLMYIDHAAVRSQEMRRTLLQPLHTSFRDAHLCPPAVTISK